MVLAGRIDTDKSGGIRNTFEAVPDVPVTEFTLELVGGNKGLLENSENLCKKPQRAIANFTGQNGKVHRTKPLVAQRLQEVEEEEEETRQAARAAVARSCNSDDSNRAILPAGLLAGLFLASSLLTAAPAHAMKAQSSSILSMTAATPRSMSGPDRAGRRGHQMVGGNLTRQ